METIDSKSNFSSSGSHASRSDDQSQTTKQSKNTSSEGSYAQLNQPTVDLAIARGEEKAVLRIRLVIVTFLTACTIGVACLVYFNTRNNEIQEFEEEFFGFSSKVLESYERALDEAFAALDSFAVSSVSLASAMNMSWPFVTIPNIGARLSKVRGTTGAVVINLVPHIQPSQKDEWNEYSLNHGPAWVDDNLKLQRADPVFDGIHLEHYEVSPIWSDKEVPLDHTHYPTWQGYPSASTFIPEFNFDTYYTQDIQPALEAMEHKHAYMSPVVNDPSRGISANVWLADYLSPSFNITEPASECYYPIYDNAANVVTLSEDGHSDEKHETTDDGNGRAYDEHEHSEGVGEQPESKDNHLGLTEEKGNDGNANSTDDSVEIIVGDEHDNQETSEEHEHSNEGKKEAGAGNNNSGGTFVAHIWAAFYWRELFTNILPTGINGLVLVVENACNQSFTYRINGPNVEFLGYGDHHDPSYDDLAQGISLDELQEHSVAGHSYTGLHPTDTPCRYHTIVYPSDTFKSMYTSSNPWVYAIIATSIFVFTSGVFWVYDILVERRQKIVMSTAVKSSAIVSSLFPSNVAARLYDLDGHGSHPHSGSQKHRLKSFINDNISSGLDATASHCGTSRPIADLFPDATVMFGDIAGFTAWSSTREPTQVFTLLESLYGAFDVIATKRKIFKVETIGDCYVAAAGLPDPRPDHAVVLTKFAKDCSLKMVKLMAQLSVTLGPDTEDLRMRFGLNSGPVTAGVLRGQKSRFQLFGDTANTASRMESTGEVHRIQVSQSTAAELIKYNKGHWLTIRPDTVSVKGKGYMVTYWVDPHEREGSGMGLNPSVGSDDPSTPRFNHYLTSVDTTPSKQTEQERKIGRLVDWNTDVLARSICGIVADQHGAGILQPPEEAPIKIGDGLPVEEVRETLTFPGFEESKPSKNPKEVELETHVVSQLREYVATVARYYPKSNPFHNFEHASHVCMSVAKLMSRIVATDEYFEQDLQGLSIEYFKYQQTFGIASDPLALFACAFAALIHDADHPGVPNTQVIKEGSHYAEKYGNRSVAEQRSVDVAWELLMQDRFQDLVSTICPTRNDLLRFRELVVNIVMATDIMDKDLKRLRNDRWEKAFDSSIVEEGDEESGSSTISMNRKATIVIEHLIQASDVAHTMQHWHIFRKWNERLFAEMLQAYECGRSEKNPVEFWYKGELGFFDFYVIPLAKKLSDCGVFGVSSDEYLNYAVKNREEWEQKGEQLVAEMVEKFKM